MNTPSEPDDENKAPLEPGGASEGSISDASNDENAGKEQGYILPIWMDHFKAHPTDSCMLTMVMVPIIGLAHSNLTLAGSWGWMATRKNTSLSMTAAGRSPRSTSSFLTPCEPTSSCVSVAAAAVVACSAAL